MNQLFGLQHRRDKAEIADVDKAIAQIINQNEDAYQDLLYRLTIRQRDLLIAISYEQKARQITGAAFVKRYHLASVSSVQKSAQALMEKQLITHQQDSYEVYDQFLALWLRRN